MLVTFERGDFVFLDAVSFKDDFMLASVRSSWKKLVQSSHKEKENK